MRASRFEQVDGRVIEHLAAGETIAATAMAVGVPEPTIRTWVHRGRSDPRGRFGRVAAAVERARSARPVPVDPEAPLPSRAELLRRLDEQSRNGSTRATELLLREVPAAGAGGSDDPIWRRLMAVPDPVGDSA